MGEMTTVLPALRYRMPEDSDKTSLGRVFEDTVARFPDNTMLIFEGRQWTYREFSAEVNQFVRVLASKGVARGHTVALFMENRPE
jgi:acyl-CoA synthetase (AMP-forming)/AMP-acid ligase II